MSMDKIRVRIKQKLLPFPRRFCVEYAYAVALTAQHLDTSAEARKCLELVAKWLNDENSVTEEELRAANDAYADDAANAANTASNAAYATYPGKNNPVKKMLEYEGMLDEKINNLSEIERLIYNCKGDKV